MGFNPPFKFPTMLWMQEKTEDARHALSLVQGREWMRRSHGLRRRTEGWVDVRVAGGSTRDGKAESYREGVYDSQRIAQSNVVLGVCLDFKGKRKGKIKRARNT